MTGFVLAALVAAVSYTVITALLIRTTDRARGQHRLLAAGCALVAVAALILIAAAAAAATATTLGFVTGSVVISIADRSRARRHRPGH